MKPAYKQTDVGVLPSLFLLGWSHCVSLRVSAPTVRPIPAQGNAWVPVPNGSEP
jgi:hypothetical protein